MRPAHFTMLLLFVAVAVLAAWIIRLHALQIHFDKIVLGSSHQQVLQMLGEPTVKTTTCRWEFVTRHVEGCAELYVYAYPGAPLLPRYPAVWFDKQGRVIDKYEYSSP